jgi:hypothetical protein
MLQAYIDESGIHDDSSAGVVAGYFGKKGPWRRFLTEWKAAFERFKVPLGAFHALDATKGRKFFSRWSADRQSEFLSALGDVVAACQIHLVCHGIFVDGG